MDIVKGKATDKDRYALFDTISNNRRYDSQILLLCLKSRSRKELQELINIKPEIYMKTNPNVPNDMNQKYYTNPKLIYKKRK